MPKYIEWEEIPLYSFFGARGECNLDSTFQKVTHTRKDENDTWERQMIWVEANRNRERFHLGFPDSFGGYDSNIFGSKKYFLLKPQIRLIANIPQEPMI